jgi:hypothetical protein
VPERRMRRRRRWKSAAVLSQSACPERLSPPLVEGYTVLPSSDGGRTTHRYMKEIA